MGGQLRRRSADTVMTPQHASQEYLAAAVQAADPLRRLRMLHERAARALRQAIGHIERGDVPAAHDAFSKARAIVVHFIASIPEGDDSDEATHFRGLFHYCHQRIVEANLRKDVRCAESALGILSTLAEGWAELDAQRLRPSPDETHPLDAVEA